MTITDDRPAIQPRAIYPIGDIPAERRHHLNEGAPEGLWDVWGWCAPFCGADGPTNGQSVEVHTPWCTSTSAIYVNGHSPEGREVGVSACLAQLYSHGVYRAEELRMGLARTASSCGSPWTTTTSTTSTAPSRC